MIEKPPTPKAAIIEPNPQQIKWQEAVNLWVDGKLTYDQMMLMYPYYPSDGFPWLTSVINKGLHSMGIIK